MFRAAILLLAWFAFMIAAVAVSARFVPVVNHAVLELSALSPYLISAMGLLVLPVLFTPWKWASVPTFVLVVVMVAFRFTLGPGSGSHPHDVPVRVLTANVFEGAADPDALIAAARNHADILVLQELTPELAASLSVLNPEFPYHSVAARPYAAGVGIWSRYPISTSSRNPNYVLGMITASIRVPGASADVTVVTVHLVGPWPQPIDGWRKEIAQLPETLRATVAASRGAVIVAGDLNATVDMRPFRQLLTDGFATARGAGLVRTWPGNSAMPPFLGIDHILTRNAVATDLKSVRVPGSDHLGLSATVHVPSG